MRKKAAKNGEISINLHKILHPILIRALCAAAASYFMWCTWVTKSIYGVDKNIAVQGKDIAVIRQYMENRAQVAALEGKKAKSPCYLLAR